MRKVEYTVNGYNTKHIGILLGWATESEFISNKNYVVAIIEQEDGRVITTHHGRVKFIDIAPTSASSATLIEEALWADSNKLITKKKI